MNTVTRNVAVVVVGILAAGLVFNFGRNLPGIGHARNGYVGLLG